MSNTIYDPSVYGFDFECFEGWQYWTEDDWRNLVEKGLEDGSISWNDIFDGDGIGYPDDWAKKIKKMWMKKVKEVLSETVTRMHSYTFPAN